MEVARLIASERMGLGKAQGRVVPKMSLVAHAIQGGQITSRYSVPQECHPTHAVTGAINVAAAAIRPGTVVAEVSNAVPLENQVFTLEHLKGSTEVTFAYEDGTFRFAGLVRTARKIMSGHIYVPEMIFDQSAAPEG